MLTRLRVQNFKNLRDVEVHFGPITVIAGPNGVGKSNLLDAIRFLGGTASGTLVQSARQLRGADTSSFDLRKIFLSSGNQAVEPMSFEADVFLRPSAEDNLGQQAVPTHRFLRYKLELRLSTDLISNSPIEIVEEHLEAIPFDKLPAPLRGLAATAPGPGHLPGPTISTLEPGKLLSLWHHSMRQQADIVANLPGKVSSLISRLNAATSNTGTAFQQELKSWSTFHLAPDRLTNANSLSDDSFLSSYGDNLPATLFRLAKSSSNAITGSEADFNNPVYARIVGKVRNLVPNLEKLWVNLEASSSTLNLMVEDSSGNQFRSQFLSDGTLRLIALAAISEDDSYSLVSLEEPENGFHPQNLIQLNRLLSQFADLDPNSPRQLLISTHSPGLVALTDEDALLFASKLPKAFSDPSPDVLRISCLSDTWRASLPNATVASRGDTISFLELAEPLQDKDEARANAVYERKEFIEFPVRGVR